MEVQKRWLIYGFKTDSYMFQTQKSINGQATLLWAH